MSLEATEWKVIINIHPLQEGTLTLSLLSSSEASFYPGSDSLSHNGFLLKRKIRQREKKNKKNLNFQLILDLQKSCKK